MDTLPDFVTPIRSGLEPTDEPTRLSPELQREVREKLRALDQARADAMVSAQFYVVHGRSSE